MGLGCLMPLSTIFQSQGGGTVSLVEETGVTGEATNLLQDTDKLYNIMLHQVHLF